MQDTVSIDRAGVALALPFRTESPYPKAGLSYTLIIELFLPSLVDKVERTIPSVPVRGTGTSTYASENLTSLEEKSR